MNSNFSEGAPGAGNSDSSVAPSFPNINGSSATSEGLAPAPFLAASEGLASARTQGPASTAACVVLASIDFFTIPPSALDASVEAGVNAFTDSITASSTLVILLLFRVVAGIFDAFGSSILFNGLRAFGCSVDFFDSGSSVGFTLASTRVGRRGSDAQEDPSISFGTSVVSMCLGW
jgi:hypothetical protein